MTEQSDLQTGEILVTTLYNNMKLYTLGEIHRLQLLKNHNGEPYKHKSTIAKIVSRMDYQTKNTAWGVANCLTDQQIEEYNKNRLV